MPQEMQVRLTPTCSDAYYHTYVDTRNRLTYQQIVVTKEGAEWRVRSRVIDVTTREILHFDPAGAKDLPWPDIPKQNEKIAEAFKKRRARVTTSQEARQRLHPASAMWSEAARLDRFSSHSSWSLTWD